VQTPPRRIPPKPSALAIASLAAFLFSFLFVGCRQNPDSTPTVHFVVPDQFKGTIEISQDLNGIALSSKSNIYTVTIPADGKLRVKSLKPLNNSHMMAASYASGNPLPLEVGPSGSPGIVALHYPARMSASKPDSQLYLVGTSEEADSFYNAP
jgi:hypothetical protein